MRTFALVLGNNDYYKNYKLVNAVNDAKAIKDVFERLGYYVLYRENFNSSHCEEILLNLRDKISSYDTFIFYFAGHGFQVDGENYLAGIECQISNPNKFHCNTSCIKLTDLLDIIKKAATSVNIVILDTCRKNFSRGNDALLNIKNAPTGTIIAFSTSPEEGALDSGMEGHSIYTGVLLKYLGRERLSVEELFKKVRKTVYTLTNKTQVTWEHTSLTGDFYFNDGETVFSNTISYDDLAIKDRNFIDKGDEFSSIILDLKSYNWNKQNPAIINFLKIPLEKLDKNQLFIFGRNILQSSGYANEAKVFIDNLKDNLPKYSINGENHILNGILFEIYFDSNGNFRIDKFKKYKIADIFKLRHNKNFSKSFEFLNSALKLHKKDLFYIPSAKDDIIDVDVSCTNEEKKNEYSGIETWQVIDQIKVSSKDITLQIRSYDITRQNELGLKKALSDFLFAPLELIEIHRPFKIEHIAFRRIED